MRDHPTLVVCLASTLLVGLVSDCSGQFGGAGSAAQQPGAAASHGVGPGGLPPSSGAASSGAPSGVAPLISSGKMISSGRPLGTGQVVPAQFTSSEPSIPGLNPGPNPGPNPSPSLSSGIQPVQTAAGAREAGLGNSDANNRPLKPPSSSEPARPQGSSGTLQMFVSVVSSLLIVVGLLLGAAWCYRRALPSAAGGLPKQVVQVLGRTPLAPRQDLVLIRFGHKLVLVSNLQGEVRTISEISDPLEVDRMTGMCESSQAGSISDSFRTVLHNIGRNG